MNTKLPGLKQSAAITADATVNFDTATNACVTANAVATAKAGFTSNACAAVTIFTISLFLISFFPKNLNSQYTPWYYWTLLPQEQMDQIVGEASGETAYKTIMETGGYTKNRRPDEYQTTFYESAYIYDKLKWYGIPYVEMERLPGRTELTWNGIKGELWETSPRSGKLSSYRDNAFMLAMGSNSANIEAELVWVGNGTPADFQGVDLKGKIAVGHASANMLHAQARPLGAAGVLAISTSRNYIDPIQLPEGRIADVRDRSTGEMIPAGFAFQMNIREGQYLIERLRRGEKITAHAVVESSMEPDQIQNVDAIIPGSDPSQTAVVFSAHIFEGLIKQGANDNKSGGAATLEVARVLHTLIEEGRIPRPKRSIRFWWGPEFAGSRPWVDNHFDEIKDAYANINMDMVGEWLSLNNAHFTMKRTTFGNPHYINDVLENYYRYVGESGRERVHNRGMADKIPNRIVAPFGADEPFHYSIETHYGSSDHIVFNDFGVRIPGVMMIAWPDLWYHTSGDLVDKSDPTQLKRAVVIAAAAAYTIANADNVMASNIAGEIYGNATSRLGHQLNIAMDMINGSNNENLKENYKKAVWLIEAHIENEKNTIMSTSQLADDDFALEPNLTSLAGNIRLMGQAHLEALKSQAQIKSQQLGAPGNHQITLTAEEATANSIVPRLMPGMYKGGRGTLEGRLSELPQSVLTQYPVIGRIDRVEIARLINGKNSVLMIKKMIDAQNRTETSLTNISNYIQQLKAAGVAIF